ncbi:hypothetical protein HDU76_011381, partial [Blyttiomyces sp. JEL0837]
IELIGGYEWTSKHSKDEMEEQLTLLWHQADGDVIMHEWVEWLRENGENYAKIPTTVSPSSHGTTETLQEPSRPIEIIHGEILLDRKSRFQARIARVVDVNEVNWVIRQIKNDSKLSTATHNMIAYRLETGLENRDDDGEGGAGDRMLYLLQKMKVQNCVAIVTRWYGGIQLGPDRFKDITGVLKQLLEESGFGH